MLIYRLFAQLFTHRKGNNSWIHTFLRGINAM